MSCMCSLAVELTLSPTGFAVGANERSICMFRQLAYLRLNLTNILTFHHPTLSVTGFAVGSMEYSLCNLMQLRKLPIGNPRTYSLSKVK